MGPAFYLILQIIEQSSVMATVKKNSPKVMGILNINNESFYSRSRCTETTQIVSRLEQMLADGASIIDIGACSTRPGSIPVTLDQEWEYLQKPLEAIAERYPAGNRNFEISIDTFRSAIVERAYNILGKFTVNDISAGEDDPAMLPIVGKLELPYIAMHKKGTPSTMQQMCSYPQGVVEEVAAYFKNFEKKAAEHGITDYIVDPGFGFAKNTEQNYTLFNGMPRIVSEIEEFSGKKRKLLVGISRKGMIWKPLGITPEEALCGTVAMNLQALMLGADILRVHDVKQARQCIKLWECLQSEQ